MFRIVGSFFALLALSTQANACWFKCYRPKHTQSIVLAQPIVVAEAPKAKVNLVFIAPEPNLAFRIDVNGITYIPNDPFAPTPPPYVNLNKGANPINGVFSVGQQLTIYMFKNGQFTGIISPGSIVPAVERTYDLGKKTWSK